MAGAAAPILIGSAIGAVTNRKNPLKGALLGGALGGAGGVLLPNVLSSFSSAAETGILPSALSGSTTSAANQALVNSSLPSSAASIGFKTAAPSAIETAKTGLFSGATPATNAAMQGQNLAQTAAIQRPLSLTMPGVEPGQGYEYTMGDRLAEVGQFAQRNPELVAMTAYTGQGLLQRPNEPQVQPAGLLRGNPTQVQAPQYQVGIPQVTLIQVIYGNYRLHP